MSAVTFSQTDRELIFNRSYSAPRELVWRAFTEADRIRKWWGPKPCPVSNCTLDFRVGGEWLYSLKCADGPEHWVKAIYQEISEFDTFTFTAAFVDENAELLVGAPSPGTATVTFTEESGKTHVNARIVCRTAAELATLTAMGMIPGFTETMDNLAEYLQDLNA